MSAGRDAYVDNVIPQITVRSPRVYAGRVAEWGPPSMPWLGRQEDFLRAWEAEKLSPSLLGEWRSR
jgi:hypothetical protein